MNLTGCIVLGNECAQCSGETLCGVPRNGLNLSASGHCHKAEVSAYGGCSTSQEHVHEGEEGVQGSYRQADLDDSGGVRLLQSSEKAEIVPQYLLELQLVHEEGEHNGLCYPSGPCSTLRLPIEHEDEKRV